MYDILESYDLSPERFKRLVYQGFDDQECEVDQVISSIVNSGVDVDKLSYLRLDAHFTGVPYGRAIDVQTLLKAATVAPIERRFHLAYGERAISALEQVVFARFWNFRTIYWHHTNRALMAMVLSVVRDVYAGRPGVTDYLRQTLFSGEWAAMRYLDAEHRRHPGGPSILDGLEHDRGLIYKRLYSLHPASDENDDRLLKALRKLPAGRSWPYERGSRSGSQTSLDRPVSKAASLAQARCSSTSRDAIWILAATSLCT